MNNQEILNQLIPLMQLESDISLDTPCAAFLDSLTFIELILHAESLFDVTVNEEALILENYASVNDFINMIKMQITNGDDYQ